MATTAGPALRAKLFGGSSASTNASGLATAGQHASEALRQATDKLAREQATSEAQVSLYRQKLGEAQQAVRKLEEAYVMQINANASLQAKVKSDYGLLSQLSTAVTSATKQYRELQKAHDQLTVLLDRAEQERSALATAFAGRSKVLAELEAKLNDSCQYSKGLQAKLDDAAKTCDTLAGELKTVKAELLGQAEARQEAELMAEKVARELTAVQTEKATLAEQLNTSTAMVETLTEELGRQSTKLAVVEEAKAALEAAIHEREAEAQQLAEQLTQAMAAAKKAEEEHAAALEDRTASLQTLSTQHASELEVKLEQLKCITEAKEGMARELADRAEALDRSRAELAELQEAARDTQAAQATKVAELSAQLEAAPQQHSRDLKALKEKHRRQQEAETERMAKKLEVTMQSMGQVKAELEAERSKATVAVGDTELLKKQLAELLAAKEEMTTTQAEASERFAKERAELEARVMEQERLLEEERRQAAKSAEQERRIAEALAMAEEARNTAMETAAKRATELEELATQTKAKEDALSKLDKENGANLLKLDSLNESLRNWQTKVEWLETQNLRLNTSLKEKELRITEQEEALHGASQRIQELDADLARKRDFLAGISTVAGLEAGKADAEEEPRGRPAEEVQHGDRTAPTRSHRSTKRVSIKEPGDLTATSEDERSSGGEEEEVANPHQALVPAGAAAKKPARRRSNRSASQRPAAVPIITEVDSGDEAQEPGADRQPSQPQMRRAMAAPASAPAQHEGEEEEERQARGRKRSGRMTSSILGGGTKKPRGGPTMSGMRSMQTTSQAVSGEVSRKRSGKATATSGPQRKQMGGNNYGGLVMKAKKKPAATGAGAAMNLFGQEIFGNFGGYGFDNISP